MLARRYEHAYEHGYEEVVREEPVIRPAASEKPRLNTRLRSKCLVLLAFVSALAMLLTFLNGLSASRGYELVQSKQETIRIEAENERLRLEVAQMKTPQRIKQIAVEDLGMQVSGKVYFASDK